MHDEVLNLLPGCDNLPPVCIDWYWTTYNPNTGAVESEYYINTTCYDPCNFSNGGAGSSTESSCANIAAQLKSGPVSAADVITEIETKPEERTFTYKWMFHKQVLDWWHYYSYEQGVHKKVSGNWQWNTLTHLREVRDGFTLGATINCTLISATPQVAIYNAGMQISYSIESSAICQGSPITYNKSYWGNSPVWNVNSTPVQ